MAGFTKDRVQKVDIDGQLSIEKHSTFLLYKEAS